MIEVQKYACSNWLITPAALAANEIPPADMRDQRFLLVLSGVAFFDLEGEAFDRDLGHWKHEVALIRPNIDEALVHAITQHQIPAPPGIAGNQYSRHFQVEQIAALAGLASIENYSKPEYNGWACDSWRAHYENRTDAFTSAPLTKLFAGIEVDLAVRAYLVRMNRLNYHVTLLGKIAFAAVMIT